MLRRSDNLTARVTPTPRCPIDDKPTTLRLP